MLLTKGGLITSVQALSTDWLDSSKTKHSTTRLLSNLKLVSLIWTVASAKQRLLFDVFLLCHELQKYCKVKNQWKLLVFMAIGLLPWWFDWFVTVDSCFNYDCLVSLCVHAWLSSVTSCLIRWTHVWLYCMNWGPIVGKEVAIFFIFPYKILTVVLNGTEMAELAVSIYKY